jgi:tetratricopeptide (TPR) repeat protein
MASGDSSRPAGANLASDNATQKIGISKTTSALFGLLLLGLGAGIGFGLTTWFRPELNLSTQSQAQTKESLPLNQSGGAGSAGLKTPAAPQPGALPASNQSANTGAATTQTPATDMEARYELLKERLNAAAEQTRQLDRLVTFLVTITTLYALALGLNSYFGLKQILEGSKEDLAQLKERIGDAKTRVAEFLATSEKELESFRTRLQEKYPELANMHNNLRDVVTSINRDFMPDRNWTYMYAEMSVQARERVTIAEIRRAGLEAFGLGEVSVFRADARLMYQGLGRFYSSKYRASRDRRDWERASLYFDEAMNLDPANSPSDLLKDVGVHLTLIEQIALSEPVQGDSSAPTESEMRVLRGRAERVFRQSLVASSEPGVLFGLGWILYRQVVTGEKSREGYRDAIEMYTKLIDLKEWPSGQRQKYLLYTYLNRAGIRVLLAADDNPSDPEYGRAIDDIQSAREVAKEYGALETWTVKVKEELEKGDLRKLRTLRPEEVERLLNG